MAFRTHEVTNVAPPYQDYDLAAGDPVLLGALDRHGLPDAERSRVAGIGRLAGSAHALELGRLANEHPPILRTHDQVGHRIDTVEFHPAWHELMTVAVRHGLHAAPWARSTPGAHLSRAAGFYLWSQAEAGHGCPVSMTYAAVPALRHAPQLAAGYEPLLAANHYEFGLRAPQDKAGLLAGMAMTEKQGGSDVRANTTQADRCADGSYLLTGHKWFCSAPMCDLFLVLAQTPAGPTCFLVPRVLPDGTHNAFALQRLKDKLGNRSNASSEVEFDRTVAFLVGDEGGGVRTILDMVTMTRLDCVLGSAATQRAAVSRAVHHVTHRSAFGTRLLDLPAMDQVVTDLALESAGATALAMRLAHAVDSGHDAFARLAVAAAKFWVCKRTPPVVAEALECLGGNGYVEDSGLPRLLRESPLNGIWEGSGNVIALDVLRALRRDHGSLAAVEAEFERVRGADQRLDDTVQGLGKRIAELGTDPDHDQRQARWIAGTMARCLQATALLDCATPQVADAFITLRMSDYPPSVPGQLPAGIKAADLINLDASVVV